MRQLLFVILLFSFTMSCGLSDSNNNNNANNIIVDSPLDVYIDSSPSWSPDGTMILYSHYELEKNQNENNYIIDPEETGLWLSNVDGSDAHMLVSGEMFEAHWNPDGSSIVFTASGNLYTVPIEDDTLVWSQLYNWATGQQYIQPRWSHDGLYFGYQKLMFDYYGEEGTYYLNYDTGLASYVDYSDFGCWHPLENKMLLINWDENSEFQLMFSMDPFALAMSDTLEPKLEGVLGLPSYSPDGSELVFQLTTSEDYQIYIMSAGGSNVRRLAYGRWPFWSPVEDKIIFAGNFNGAFNDNINDNSTIWTIKSDGTELTQITHGLSQ